jgi:general secretion pathway protein F
VPAYRVRVHEPPAAPAWRRVEAADEAAVPRALGLPPARVLEVLPAAAAATAVARWPWRRAARIEPRLFAQELAVLLDSGVPLLEAVQTLAERHDGAAEPLAPVIAALREGRPLSQALAEAGPAFDAVLRALVAASERDGQLVAVLRHHAAFLAWSEQLRDRLVAAAVYPVMLLAVGLAVVGFLLVHVLPRFAGVFEGLATDLPAGSRWLLALGSAVQAQPQLAVVLALLLPVLLVLALRQGPLRRWAEARAWSLPGLGLRLRVLALARLYRMVGLLARAGVPLPQALALAEPVLAAPLRPALLRAREAVASGLRLSAAWQAEGLATPPALRMLRVGESSGTVPLMLERAAAFHDEEVARLAELVTRVVNPALMLLMGVLIGGIVVLMYLPIFTLMEQVG